MSRLRVFIIFILGALLATTGNARALEISFGGAMRIRANVQGEFDGKNEWLGSQIQNARAGIYTPDDVYDRGSHFFASGPGGEDNPAAAGYVGFTSSPTPYRGAVADYGTSGGEGANAALGPALTAPAGFGTGTNIRNDQDLGDDENLFFDQRLELEVFAKIAECVKVVNLFRIEGTWGQPGMGADWGADDVVITVINSYVDFSVPRTPLGAIVGVQTFSMHRGWLINIEGAGAILTASFDPVALELIYIRALERGAFEDRADDVDIYGASVTYGQNGLSGRATLFYQDGPASTFTSADSKNVGGVDTKGNTVHWYCLDLDYAMDRFSAFFTGIMNGGSNDYYRLDDRSSTGAATAAGMMKPVEADYNGYLLNAGVGIPVGPVTLMLEGLYISGDEFEDHTPGISPAQKNFFRYQDSDDSIDRYVWTGIGIGESGDSSFSEIIGQGLFDQASPGPGSFGQWMGGASPYNLWFVKVGGDYKVSDLTKVNFSYYYFNTAQDVVSSIDELSPGSYGQVRADDTAIGHEINLVIEQQLCDNLVLSVVGAYLFSDDAFSIYSEDEDAYEYGVRLFVNF